MSEIKEKNKEAKLETTETLFCPKCDSFMSYLDLKEKILECRKHGLFKYNGGSKTCNTPAPPQRFITIPKSKKKRDNT